MAEREKYYLAVDGQQFEVSNCMRLITVGSARNAISCMT